MTPFSPPTLLSDTPENPLSLADRLFEAGTQALAAGDEALAERAYREALAHEEAFPEVHSNLAGLLLARGAEDEALAHYDRALALGFDHAAVHYNRGNLLKGLERLDEAVAAYRQALACDSSYPAIHNNLGNALFRRNGPGDWEAATAAYLAAVALTPGYDEAHGNLAVLLHSVVQSQGVAAVRPWIEQWRKDFSEHPMASYVARVLLGEAVPDRAPPAYVRLLFDQFAGCFDSTLERLGYRGPDLLAQVLQDLPVPPGREMVLDAGCGTGLCGPVLRSRAYNLTGIDLSPAMLKIARQREVYDELIEAELGTFLQRCPGGYDLIAATDVLCYFGDLGEILPALAQALRPAGHVLFTLEAMTEEAMNEDGGKAPFRLVAHGRYVHQPAAVEAACAAAGLTLLRFEPVILRQEGGQPVNGLLGVGQRR